MVTSILRTQGFDRIEFSGAHGGEDAEEETNKRRQAERENDGAKGGLHWEGEEVLDQENESVGGDDPDDATGSGENGGLGEELEENVFFSCAERTAEADFAGALGNAGKHDVHDDDAADDEKDANKSHGDEGEVTG